MGVKAVLYKFPALLIQILVELLINVWSASNFITSAFLFNIIIRINFDITLFYYFEYSFFSFFFFNRFISVIILCSWIDWCTFAWQFWLAIWLRIGVFGLGNTIQMTFMLCQFKLIMVADQQNLVALLEFLTCYAVHFLFFKF